MEWTIPLLGFAVGLLVGLTGIGGAALMTPLLILVGGVRPVIAVGTDLAYGAITKAVGAFLHYRQQTVDFPIAKHLAMGSIPMALAGVALIHRLQRGAGHDAIDRFVTQALGLALILVAASLLCRPFSKHGTGATIPPAPTGWQGLLTIVVGGGVGLLVGLTSVGSGSLIAAALMAIYPRLPLRRVVGTDILHAAFLTVAAGLAHVGLGNVDGSLLGRLLMGSIPGVWFGTRLAVAVPEKLLRPILATLLLGIGYKML